MDGRQNTAAQIFSIGLGVGLDDLGITHDFVDLGEALGEVLDDPSLVDRFFEGERILLKQSLIGAGPDAIYEQKRILDGSPYVANGFPPDRAEPGHPKYEFLRVSTPTSYASQQDIDESLARYRRQLDELATLRADPMLAFDGLRDFQTFGIAYCGEDVTDILRTVGERVVAPIVARAFPDLVEPIEIRKPEGKLKVGYLSANIREQNAANWALGWLRNHDEDIEKYVVATGVWQDKMSLEFREIADHYYHVPGDVPTTGRFVKSLRLDVLIIPDIGNFGMNYQYSGMRLAPVQCTAWGQPVTSGLPTIDYYLSSDLMEPENGQDHYTEKLVRLPGSGLFISRFNPPTSTKTREDFGVPEGFVYLVAQNPRKLTPKWDYLYREIQERTGAPIVFVDFNVESATEGAKKRLKEAGVKATWLPAMSQEDFARLHQVCDVSLDPPAWNGGNTTMQSIQLGHPVVSLSTEFMRGRHGRAFLTQAGLSGMIANTPEEYVALAVDRDRIAEVMAKAEPDGMFEDPQVPRALDAFLRRVSGR
jgi:predicted O-linked N-acetylglucosamine transferase (SPINDLY family)